MTVNNFLEKIGRFLFRYRAAIAVPFFVLLCAFGRTQSLNLILIFLMLAGIGLRIWASGYIGKDARKKEFRTACRIINGPYRLLKHPLYLGNLLLVVAVTIIFYPPLWLFILIIAAFLVVYSLIIIGESGYIKKLPSSRVVFSIKNAGHEISTLLVIVFILTIYFIKRIS